MEQTECSETSAYKFQPPGNHPKETIQHIATPFFNRVLVKWKHFPSKAPHTKKHCFILWIQDLVHLPSFKCNMGHLRNDMVARKVKFSEKNVYEGNIFLTVSYRMTRD